MHRRVYKTNEVISTKIGEVIHTDVCGFVEMNSLGGSRYFLLFKDALTHYRHVYFLKNKSEVYEYFKNSLQRIEKETRKKINTLKSDNGLEFVNKKMNKLMLNEGIEHVRTTPYTPEQNGRVERDNRTIVEAARTMHHSANLPKALWAEMVNTAVHVLNRTGTSSKENKTPFQLWTGNKTELKNLKVVGTLVKVHKQYRIWFPETNKVEVCTDVEFLNEKYKKKESNKINTQRANQESSEDSEQEDETTEENNQTEPGQIPGPDQKDQNEENIGELNEEVEREIDEQQREEPEEVNESLEEYEDADQGDHCAAQNCKQPRKTKID